MRREESRSSGSNLFSGGDKGLTHGKNKHRKWCYDKDQTACLCLQHGGRSLEILWQYMYLAIEHLRSSITS